MEGFLTWKSLSSWNPLFYTPIFGELSCPEFFECCRVSDLLVVRVVSFWDC